MRLSILALALLNTIAAAADPVTFEQRYPVETGSGVGKKIVIIVGGNYYKPGEHDYKAAGAALLTLLKQTPGVDPVWSVEWPKKPETLKDAAAVVFFFDGAEKHLALQGDHAKQIQTLIDAKAGVVQFHQTIDYPKDFGDRARIWAGGCWEKGLSQRAHWVAEFDKFPAHDIFNGVKPFKIDDGWLWKLHFVAGMKGVTPLLQVKNPKAAKPETPEESTVAWTYDRPDGGRTFNFTGGHLHESFQQEGYRRYLTNAMLWTACVPVPKDGAKVEMDDKTLASFLTPKPAGAK